MIEEQSVTQTAPPVETFPYKRVLVTGGHGFLGKHVVRALQSKDVDKIAIPSSVAGRWSARRIGFFYDLRYEEDVVHMLCASRPELVIHLAARVGGIGFNAKNPAVCFYDNLQMGLNIIEQCHQRGVRKLILVGSVCSYPRLCAVPFREDDLYSGFPDPSNASYGLAKLALLTASVAYREQYGLNSIYLIPANMYGSGDNFDLENSHVIPALIRKFVEAKQTGASSVEVWGDGTATRDFLYVEDCARAIVRAAMAYDGPLPINIGTGVETRMDTLATMIANEVGFKGDIAWDTSRPNGQPRRVLDTSRAQESLNWKAGTLLKHGIARTVAWYKEHPC